MAFKIEGIKEAAKAFERLTLDEEDKNRITRAVHKPFQKILDNVRKSHYWTDRTGELTRSHYTKVLNTFSLEVGARAKHAKFLAFGTKRHFIQPIKAKALHWRSGGASFFSKGHFVKGIKKKPWLIKEVMKVMPDIKTAIKTETVRIIEGK